MSPTQHTRLVNKINLHSGSGVRVLVFEPGLQARSRCASGKSCDRSNGSEVSGGYFSSPQNPRFSRGPPKLNVKTSPQSSPPDFTKIRSKRSPPNTKSKPNTQRLPSALFSHQTTCHYVSSSTSRQSAQPTIERQVGTVREPENQFRSGLYNNSVVCFPGVTTHRGCIFHSPVAGFSLLVFEVY
jgi:hypothetical protein